MSKKLDEMTNDELWQLFPIILTPYQESWKLAYETEKEILFRAFGNEIVRINHIGSTSVPGLTAKPTIDILLEVDEDIDISMFHQKAIKLGYLVSVQHENPAPHLLLKRGYTELGFVGQAYHIHVRYPGDWGELYFCDYLRNHPSICMEYEDLKYHLQKQYEHNRNKYTEGKSDFILSITQRAKDEYQNRYKPLGK